MDCSCYIPCRLGGLAIPQVSVLAPSAYLGARIDYYNSLPNSSDKDAVLRELETLLSKWNGKFVPSNEALKLEVVLEQQKPQKYLSTLASNHRYRALIQDLPEGIQKARIKSNAESQSRWLHVYPSFGFSARNFLPHHFQIALRLWLGLPLGIYASNNPSQSFRCKCGKSSDIFGLHLSRCNKLHASVHNHLVKLLMRYMKEAHMDVVDEPPDLLQDGTRDRPADILYTPNTSLYARKVCYDVTFTSYANSFEAATLRKLKKYEERCQKVGLHFVPLPVNSLGRLGYQFDPLIKDIGEAKAYRSETKPADIIREIRTDVQFQVLKELTRNMWMIANK